MILDAGFFIGIERLDRRVLELGRRHHASGQRTVTSAAVLAQVWRGGPRQTRLAVWLRGVEVIALDESAATRIGSLLGASTTSDVADAHLATLFQDLALPVATGDRADMERLGVPPSVMSSSTSEHTQGGRRPDPPVGMMSANSSRSACPPPPRPEAPKATMGR